MDAAGVQSEWMLGHVLGCDNLVRFLAGAAFLAQTRVTIQTVLQTQNKDEALYSWDQVTVCKSVLQKCCNRNLSQQTDHR
jgi:hypothetical protein